MNTMSKKQQKKMKKGKAKSQNATLPQPLPGRYKRRKLKRTGPPDPRAVPPVTGQMDKVMGDATVQTVVELPQQFLAGIVIGYLSEAIRKGILEVLSDPYDLYNAGNYILQIMTGSVTNTTSLAQKVPRWLACYSNCLNGKSVPYGQGKISYAFAILNPRNLENNYVVGPSTYGCRFLMWAQAIPPVYVDGFPLAQPPGPPPADQGQAAFNSLIKFMEDKEVITPYKGAAELVLQSQIADGRTNVSIFAMNYYATGAGFQNLGGVAYTLGLEVPVFFPLLGTIVFGGNPNSQVPVPSRYPKWNVNFSGDPILTGALISTTPYSKWGLKKMPCIKFIDFLEFGDVLAQWVSGFMTTYVNDLQNNGVVNEGSLSTLVCPLTLQEVLLLLRNDMLLIFAESQGAVQSLFPFLPENNLNNQFLSYAVGTNCAALGGTGAEWPKILVENMKCLTLTSNEGIYWLPALGQFFTDSLNSGDYIYTFNGVSPPVSTNCFSASPPTMSRRRDSKGTITWAPSLVETKINLWDGSCVVSGSNSWAFINELPRLRDLAATWNKWLTQFKGYSTSTVTAAYDKGVNIFRMQTMTRHFTAPSNSSKVIENEHHRGSVHAIFDPEEMYRDPRSNIGGKILTSVYTQKMVVADTSAVAFQREAYEMFQKLAIAPCHFAETGTLPPNQQDYVRYQEFNKEPFYMPYSATGNSGTTLAVIHQSYAALMYKQRSAPLSPLEEFLQEADKRGTGGVLSSLAAGWIGQTFGSTAGAIAGAVADILPI
jgi:hypothetical protein